MKTMHLHFTVDPTPVVRVRLFGEKPGVEISIGDVDTTMFFNTGDARAEWLQSLRAQIDAALEATTTIPDDVLPAALVAI